MGPSRPKIYTTPKEKLMANQIKNRRSYHKNKTTTSTLSEPLKSVPNVLSKKPAGCLKVYKTPEDKARANRAKSKRSYDNVQFGNSSILRRKVAIGVKQAVCYRAETANHYVRFKSAQKAQPLNNDPTTVSGWMAILVGVGKELHKAEALNKAITEAISSLDNVLCYTMGGYSEVVEMHAKGLLMYQSYNLLGGSGRVDESVDTSGILFLSIMMASLSLGGEAVSYSKMGFVITLHSAFRTRPTQADPGHSWKPRLGTPVFSILATQRSVTKTE
ncbi:hypothetical protein BDN71DRAFT_1436926 [Pleurotus eryngii]|uniref:Uncharacterized protein n=1 Tax=Pleurotus eryngii TaxID=5323 RepID=A0A9P6D870_PLEER|nr:hypothetical protein BDN71DRAFT_1436926 [Pleurotus eryngii]